MLLHVLRVVENYGTANNFCWNRLRLFKARIWRSRIFFSRQIVVSIVHAAPCSNPRAATCGWHLTLLVSLAPRAKWFSRGHNGRILAALHGENIYAGKKSWSQTIFTPLISYSLCGIPVSYPWSRYAKSRRQLGCLNRPNTFAWSFVSREDQLSRLY